MKVFLVIDDEPSGPYHAASTYAKARKWIKQKQLDDINMHKERGWTEKQLEAFRSHYEDADNLHPYDIQEMVIDEE